MVESVRVDIGSRSLHEEALLAMQNDLIPRYVVSDTPEPYKVANIAALEAHVYAVGLKDKVDGDNFSIVKGRVMAKLTEELKAANERRFRIAEKAGSLESILGGSDDEPG